MQDIKEAPDLVMKPKDAADAAPAADADAAATRPPDAQGGADAATEEAGSGGGAAGDGGVGGGAGSGAGGKGRLEDLAMEDVGQEAPDEAPAHIDSERCTPLRRGPARCAGRGVAGGAVWPVSRGRGERRATRRLGPPADGNPSQAGT